jgi:predicted RNA-binding protein with PIN domain
MSARELMIEMDQLRNTGIRQVIGKPVSRRNPIGERLSPEVRERLEQMRKGYNNRG